MDCRSVLLFCLAVFLAILLTSVEGRTKKVVIHVPFKVKKIKHTHTVFKTIHHHHSHHDHHDHLDTILPAEEHEHFHHMHLDEAPIVQNHQIPNIGITGMGIPDFLPDAPLDLPLSIPDLPRDITGKPKRLNIPKFIRE
ncbi:protein eyes shut-like isoform X2 [Vanessa atalanta]|uniref:protein eyes shut-like isoform X2 n=1 Tax=Vanessa atalanta TaxID=42275 RepID=UPI001FCDEFFD|nr:protein eyes shut-like isoform X2 [Vanessa atalanta]